MATKFDSGKYDFVGLGNYILPVWFVIMVIGMIVIGVKGFNYGVDFAGGTEVQVRFQNVADIGVLREALAKAGYEKASVQTFGEANEFLIRIDNEEAEAALKKAAPAAATTETSADSKVQKAAPNQIGTNITGVINEQFKDNPHEIRRVDTVGPQVGEELKRNSILAAFYSLIMILIYVGLRFDYKYAPGAVFCLLHDAIIMISIYSVFGQEVNVQTLAAILTLMGVALNATIILYDRIRENEAEFPDEDFAKVVNKSHNDILSRTIITTVIMELSVVALYTLSDGVVQQIAYTLMIGILLGAFSSTYIAGTIVIELNKWQKKREAIQLKRRSAARA